MTYYSASWVSKLYTVQRFKFLRFLVLLIESCNIYTYITYIIYVYIYNTFINKENEKRVDFGNFSFYTQF